MNKLRISFSIRFDDHHIDFCPYGPLTHRWLPDGENDAILLNAGHSDYELKVWFKRRGKTDKNSIRFSLNEFNVDPSVISKQAILDAGPISGELVVKNIDPEKYNPVINNEQNEDYSKFANEIIRVIMPPLNNFLRILRFKHGQYWINEIEDFDSRSGSLGNYCNNMAMKWSNDDGEKWNDFQPTNLVMKATTYLGDRSSYVHDYLTKNDWNKISSEINNEFKSSLSKELCIRSWQYFDQGDIKHAIIESITALEVCISEIINQGLGRLNTTIEKIDDFKHSKLTTKLTVVCSLKPIITETELIHSIEIYEIRNKIVHDGQEPPEWIKTKSKFKSLLNLISKLTMNKEFKFPSTNSGNAFMSEEEWDKIV